MRFNPAAALRSMYRKLPFELVVVKCKDVREDSPERGKKALKCEQSIELSAVMETFNMRWIKIWE